MSETRVGKKVVVTGSSGFLGRHLVDRLKNEDGWIVFALSSKGEELQKRNTLSNLRYCRKDLSPEAAREVFRGAVVVNCAFPRNSTGAEMADGLRYVRDLFESAVRSGVSALINISSQSVYSAKREAPATEEEPLSLDSPYAVGKYAAELMLESVCRESGVRCTNVRLASLIGPGFDQRIVNRLIQRALGGEPLSVNRSGQRFGFLDVEDAVSALVSLLKTDPALWRPVYNVGSGSGCSVEEIARGIAGELEKRGLPVPEMTFENGAGSGTTAVDCRLLSRDTGFEPKIDLSGSISRIIDHEISKRSGTE